MAAAPEPDLSSFRKTFQQGTSTRATFNPMSSDLGTQKFGFVRQEFDYGTGFYEGRKKVWMRHGPGLLVETGVSSYIGQFLNDVKHGHGNLAYADGSSYTGEWQDGVKTGKGTYSSSIDKTSYSGRWLNGMKHGEGVQTFANGDSYEGTYFGGLRSGLGTKIYEDGSQFSGCFAGGRYNGGGILYGSGDTRERLIFEQGTLMKREILRPGKKPAKIDRARPVVHVQSIQEKQTKIDMLQETILGAKERQHFPHLIMKVSNAMDLSAPSIRKQLRDAKNTPREAAQTVPRTAAQIAPRTAAQTAHLSGRPVGSIHPAPGFDEMSSQEISICESAHADHEVARLVGVGDLPERLIFDKEMEIRPDALGYPEEQVSVGGASEDEACPTGGMLPESTLALHA